jgi:uncharacterized protein YkwD
MTPDDKYADAMNGHIRLLAVLSALAALALPTPAEAATTCPDADLVPTRSNRDRVRGATLCLVNRLRVAHGRAPLTVDRDLAKAANTYVNKMTSRGFFSHVSPDGSTPESRIKVTLYLVDARSWSLGENLAWGDGHLATPRETVAAWIRSASHRRNMLSSRFRQLGVGIALGTPQRSADAGATYATEFGVRIRAR